MFAVQATGHSGILLTILFALPPHLAYHTHNTHTAWQESLHICTKDKWKNEVTALWRNESKCKLTNTKFAVNIKYFRHKNLLRHTSVLSALSIHSSSSPPEGHKHRETEPGRGGRVEETLSLKFNSQQKQFPSVQSAVSRPDVCVWNIDNMTGPSAATVSLMDGSWKEVKRPPLGPSLSVSWRRFGGLIGGKLSTNRTKFPAAITEKIKREGNERSELETQCKEEESQALSLSPPHP